MLTAQPVDLRNGLDVAAHGFLWLRVSLAGRE